MEKKIGEIFEYNGEWYQCVKGDCCRNCDFYDKFKDDICFAINNCSLSHRSDKTSVIFKKLEKVGEPHFIEDEIFEGGKVYVQNFKVYTDFEGHKPICNDYIIYDWKNRIISIEIKQNKEDMEQEIEYFGDENAKCFNSESIEKNLKPFNLDAAKQGKPVCTRDGSKARIICFDRKDNTPIVALIERVDGIEILECVHNDGKCFHYDTSDNDLMMLPEKKEGWVNVYKGIGGVRFSKHPYTSKDEAIKKSSILFGRIDTIKVSWEE